MSEELQGHLTPVQVPQEVQAVPGVKTHHLQQETVEHAQQLQSHGVDAQPAGPSALVAPATNTPITPPPVETKNSLLFPVTGITTAHEGHELVKKRIKLMQGKELKNAA